MSETGMCGGHRLGVIPVREDKRDWTAKRLFGHALEPVNRRASLFGQFPKIRSQGNIGSCGPHSAWWNIGLMASQAGVERDASPMFVYWVTRYLMGSLRDDSGVDNRALMKALTKYGACSEALWTYGNSLFEKPGREAFREALKWQLKGGGYARLNGVDEACGVIDVKRRGVIVAVPVYESFEGPQAMKTGLVPMPDVRRERLLGYHDMAGVGYDLDGGLLTCANSWGPEAGDRGLFHLPLAYPFLEFWAIEASETGVNDPKQEIGTWELMKRKWRGMA